VRLRCSSQLTPAVVDDKFFEAISAPEAWQVVEDYADAKSGILRPTNSALRVRDLVDQVADRFRPLPSAAHRLRFHRTVQLPLLEAYRARISSALDAFDTLTSGLIRAVPGAMTGDGRLTAGVSGLQRLVRAGVSARWIAGVCEGWSEDLVRARLVALS